MLLVHRSNKFGIIAHYLCKLYIYHADYFFAHFSFVVFYFSVKSALMISSSPTHNVVVVHICK